MKQEHYCTYFDSGFVPQGVALWRSLRRHDPEALLWVLALDDGAAALLRYVADDSLRITSLAELEAADPELAAVKSSRSRVEYFFTLSPCWPRSLLRTHPDIDRITYLDADLLFFARPQELFDELGNGSILLCEHDFPSYLRHYEKHGRYNVGVQIWRRDAAGMACLDWWRERCLDWCFDRLEADRYADQKYLEQWPVRFDRVVECRHPGVNLAPWNWMSRRVEIAEGGGVRVDGRSLVVFHFARFCPLLVDRWWRSGQLDYGIMPWRMRQAIYGAYWKALADAHQELRRVYPQWRPPRRRGSRLNRAFWRELPFRLLFGSDWLRIGGYFVSGRLGLGRYSGRVIAWLRTTFFRNQRAAERRSQNTHRQAGK